MALEQKATYYDTLFQRQEFYQRHYTQTHYYVQWVQVEMMLRAFRGQKILEIGCGTGQLAHMLEDLGYTNYEGFDFSPVAVEKAKAACKQQFFVGDALDASIYQRPYDVVVSLEVFEHIKKDLDILKLIKSGTYVIISIPNFDDKSHVRWFRSQYQVRKRYYRLIDIKRIHFINNIYIIGGIRSDFKPNLFQRILKTRQTVSLSSIWKRILHRIHHFFKIKHA